MVTVRENLNLRETTNQTTIPSELEKVLNEMENCLLGPKMWFCIRTNNEERNQKSWQGYYERTGINALNCWLKLLPYYQNNSTQLLVLDELKERIEKIKNNELPVYNKNLALTICRYLKEC